MISPILFSLLYMHVIRMSVCFRIALFLLYFAFSFPFKMQCGFFCLFVFKTFQLLNTDTLGMSTISCYSGDTSTGWHIMFLGFFLTFLFSSQNYSCNHLRFAPVFSLDFFIKLYILPTLPFRYLLLYDNFQIRND